MKRENAIDHRHLGILRHRLGDPAEAVTHLVRALALAVDVGLPWTVMLVARSMARVLVGKNSEMAARLLGHTEAVQCAVRLPAHARRTRVDRHDPGRGD